MAVCSKVYNGLFTEEQHDSLNKRQTAATKRCYSLVGYTEGMSGRSVLCVVVLMPMSSSDEKRK